MPIKRDYMVLHVDLFVRSMTAALDFYCDKLKFAVVDDAFLEGPIPLTISGGNYSAVRLVLLRSSAVGAMIELQEFQPDSALSANALQTPLRTGWVSILVPDLRELMGHLRANGVSASSEILVAKLRSSRACELVLYKDPDGNDLEFVQIMARAAAG